jgi:hypothetical protein
MYGRTLERHINAAWRTQSPARLSIRNQSGRGDLFDPKYQPAPLQLPNSELGGPPLR